MYMKCADIPMGGWVGACQITKNGINLNLIEIIQVYLKIYDLWRLCHPHTYPPSGVRHYQLKFLNFIHSPAV